jgi:hypothetical protein
MGTVNSGNKKVNSGQNKKRFTSQQFRFIRNMFHGFVVSACPLDENMVLANQIFHLHPNINLNQVLIALNYFLVSCFIYFFTRAPGDVS